MTNSIVTVNVSQTVAPTPSVLQKSGAFISCGGTTTAPGTKSLLTQASDLTAILKGALAITSISWSANVATVTTAAPHGIVNGQTIEVVIAGATPSAYNGTVAATSTGASTFTYPLLSNPGGSTSVPGTWTPEDVGELVAMNTTYWAQGSQQAVWVLELGDVDVTDAVTYLTTWIAANPGTFYAYLVPRTWDGNAAFLTLLASFESLTAKTYFFITTTTGNYTSYTALMKCAFPLVEAPAIPSTEFTNAWPFFVELNQSPSSTNRVPQMAYQFGFGVTPYPTAGNAALLATLKAANINYCGTGAEGGISTAILLYGTTADGRDMLKWWYGIDWAQINAQLTLANTVINGSNNKSNPLYYNQDGINRLQSAVASLMASGIANGIVLGPIVLTELDSATFNANVENGVYAGQTPINAVPFLTYLAANPSDYKAGSYAGLSVAMTPQLGFKQIVFNLNVSDFVAG